MRSKWSRLLCAIGLHKIVKDSHNWYLTTGETFTHCSECKRAWRTMHSMFGDFKDEVYK